MRNSGFVAEYRGGSLTKKQHRQLIRWASDCATHVLPLFGDCIDERLTNALSVAGEWELGNATVGEARKASLDAIKVANETSNSISIAVARSVGHAVATAHMADHSLRAAQYALKAIKVSGKLVDQERKWQYEQIPPEIRDLVLSTRNNSK